MTTSLCPGTVLSHYRVISLLGAGGMGEVYLARDETLGRNVALKILPPTLMQEEQRVRRFIQEARSASSLSHPHIVTIYEILQADLPPEAISPEKGTPPEEAPPSSVHFIAMEFVAGSTLRDLIYRQKTDLRTLLRYLAQAADGLAKAHAAGIIHRDLKPDNIMVSEDGYAKVLDFGLAKLVERATPTEGATGAPTAAPEITQEGMVVGTVAYMSPEQIQARDVDHRTDIFSFGCLLYEAATRRRPFVADSSVEVMHRILRENPPPIEEINPDVPAELRRLIRRCLAKSPEQRLQSMKDLAIELAEIVEEYDQLAISSDSRPSSLAGVPLGRTRRSAAFRAGLAAVVILGIAGVGFGLWRLRERGGGGQTTARFQSMNIARLMSVENLVDCALSPDGKYLATVTMEAGRSFLRVRQIATGSDVQVLPPQERRIDGARFTPDGNYLYFLWRDPEKSIYSWLYRVPALGGTPQKVAFDVDTPPAFSPDGRTIAFIRVDPKVGQEALVVANADGGSERQLASIRVTRPFAPPSWSPDGQKIALLTSYLDEGQRPGPAEVAVSNGAVSRVAQPRELGFYDVAWLPDGGGLLGIASRWSDPATQVWLLSPSGKERRITNDLNQYSHVSISADSKTIAAAQTRRRASLWAVPAADPGSAHPITEGPAEEGLDWVRAGPSGTVVFTATGGAALEIWNLDPANGHRTRLTPEGVRAADLAVAGDTGLIVFSSFGDDGALHVWRMDADGGNRSQVTDGAGEEPVGISPDGQAIFFRDMAKLGVWRMPLAGGQPVKLWEQRPTEMWDVSRDGKFVLHDAYNEIGGFTNKELVVAPAEGGPPVQTRDMPDGFYLHWAPSGKAITYVHQVNGVHNIWMQELNGGEPRQITRFESGQIFDYDWSPDGTQIFLSRGEETTDIVLITGFR